MHQERLYTLVGLFVGGALCLTVFTALFFYDEYLHERVETYVMFFRGSLAGLNVTSTVTYRGVKIGEVKLIEVTENKTRNRIKIPVYVQFFVEKHYGVKQRPIQLLIQKGFVANISKPNFLTGIASIELIEANPPRQFKEASYHGYPIFPTNDIFEHYATLDETLSNAKKAFQDISDFIHSTRVNETIDATKKVAENFDRLVNNLGKQVPPVLTSFTQSLKNFDRVANNLDRQMPSMLTIFNQSLKSFDRLTNNLDQQVPPMIASVNQSLKQISDAANSTQNLTDYLSRYPESLIRGKR